MEYYVSFVSWMKFSKRNINDSGAISVAPFDNKMNMEGLAFIGLIWGILCIVLFFKVWKACNNIQRLADKYVPENVKKETVSKQGKSTLETREDIDKWLKEE